MQLIFSRTISTCMVYLFLYEDCIMWFIWTYIFSMLKVCVCMHVVKQSELG
jgi:hypothetical protein